MPTTSTDGAFADTAATAQADRDPTRDRSLINSAAAAALAPSPTYEMRVLQALRRIIRAVDLYSRKLAALHQVTAPQLVCLLAVAELGPATVSSIARQVHLSSSTVVGILDRLERRGLVERRRDVTDRRLVYVQLTDLGRGVAEEAPSPLQDTLATALQALPSPEQETIADSLERLVALMEAQHLDAAPILETGSLLPTPGDPREHPAEDLR